MLLRYILITILLALAQAFVIDGPTSRSTTSFVQSLRLSTVQAGQVSRLLESFSDSKADLACSVAGIVLPSSFSDPVNLTIVESNWSAATWRTPSCAVSPRSAQEVAQAIKIIGQFQVKFAVRSGGHSPNPGWASIGEPGILIDMGNLNQVTLSPDRQSVTIGPGQRWGSVYQMLDASGVAVIGGRVPDVGVGGFILGGGINYFSSHYGLAVDSLKSFEVVLPDGSVTTASSQKNADLFWALKGGGANFGIVTKYEMRTIPQARIWYSVLVYRPDQAPALLEAFADYQQDSLRDNKSGIALIMGLDSITVGMAYAEPSNNPTAFRAFFEIPPLTTAVPAMNGSFASLSQIFTSAPTRGNRHEYRAASSLIDAQLYQDVYNDWRPRATRLRQQTGANMTFVLQPISPNVAVSAARNGGSPINVPTQNHQWWTTLMDWEDSADDDVVRSVAKETTDKWKEIGEARGKYLPFEFMNDASRDQNPIGSYGAASIGRLKSISRKYDPEQLFQSLQTDGFLLSKI